MTRVPPDADGRYRWVILGVATIAQVGTAVIYLGVGVLSGFIQERFELSGAQTGLLITAIGIVPLFALIPVGRFLDHHSERHIITGGALVLGLGVAVASLVDSYLILLVVFTIAGAGYATAQPGGSKVVAAWFPARERGVAMGIRQTGLPLGGALAAATLPWIAESFGVRSALLTAAGASIGGGLLFFALYRPAPAPAATAYRLRRQLLVLLAEFRIRTAMWAGLVMVSAQFSLLSYLMLYLRDVHGVALTRGAWMLFAAQMMGVAGRVILARWSDRLPSGRLTAVLASVVATAIGATTLAVLPSGTAVPVLFILAAVIGFWAFGWYGPWVVHVAETADGHAVGLTLALAMTANQLGLVAAPPIFGLIVDLADGNYRPAWVALSFVLLVAASRILAGVRREASDMRSESRSTR
ncbi:MAG: MFS transporter [Acidimicrobiia bacterium]|nr:MFS transporter [Acidimicrobiia bacterium]